jgi:hypothetical protein
MSTIGGRSRHLSWPAVDAMIARFRAGQFTTGVIDLDTLAIAPSRHHAHRSFGSLASRFGGTSRSSSSGSASHSSGGWLAPLGGWQQAVVTPDR